jgi:hypothetical protein
MCRSMVPLVSSRANEREGQRHPPIHSARHSLGVTDGSVMDEGHTRDTMAYVHALLRIIVVAAVGCRGQSEVCARPRLALGAGCQAY